MGDANQLSPTVLSRQRRTELSVSPMERLLRSEETPSVMLTVQHRSSPQIVAFPSKMFYHGKIDSAPNMGGPIADTYSLIRNDLTTDHMVLVPTIDMPECIPANTKSYANDGECRLVTGLVRDLIASGVAAPTIGVLTPYSAQVSLLTKTLDEFFQGISVSTIDCFQGIILTNLSNNKF